MEQIVYRLDTRDRPRLLIAMMRSLVAEDSKISLEGRLSQTELAKMDGVTHEETRVLKRATIQPQIGFLGFASQPAERRGNRESHRLEDCFWQKRYHPRADLKK
jgi:hypothetical protein